MTKVKAKRNDDRVAILIEILVGIAVLVVGGIALYLAMTVILPIWALLPGI